MYRRARVLDEFEKAEKLYRTRVRDLAATYIDMGFDPSESIDHAKKELRDIGTLELKDRDVEPKKVSESNDWCAIRHDYDNNGVCKDCDHVHEDYGICSECGQEWTGTL